jgi:segregation and condensation protein B
MQTNKSKLTQVIEATLFVSGQGIEIKDLVEKLEVDKKDVLKSIEELKKKHQDDGINIITYKDSVQMCSNPDFAEDIATVLNPIREKQLTKAALETAAIVAYKQPVTKLDIEQVRGVNSDYAMQVLTSFKLVEVVSRKDAVGKPLLYGTTDEFLKRFELQSINDLPDYDELLERIKVLHADQNKTDALYGSTEIIPEEQLADSKAKQTEAKNDKEEKTENDQPNAETNNNTENSQNDTKQTGQGNKPNDQNNEDQKVINTLVEANIEENSNDVIGGDDFGDSDTL